MSYSGNHESLSRLKQSRSTIYHSVEQLHLHWSDRVKERFFNKFIAPLLHYSASYIFHLEALLHDLDEIRREARSLS